MRRNLVLRFSKSSIETGILASMLFCMPLCYYINLVVQNGLGIGVSVTPVFYIFLAICGIFSYMLVISRKSSVCGFAFIFFLLGTLLYVLFNAGSVRYIYTNIADLAYNPSIILFLYCLPTLFFCICGKIDNELLLKKMCGLGRFVLILYSVCFFIFRIGTKSLSIEYMTFSYNALPSICICLSYKEQSKTRRFFAKALAVLGLIITLIAGARGALVCNIFFICLLVLFSNQFSSRKKFFLVMVMAVVAIVIAFYLDKILMGLATYLNSVGIYSRTLSKAVQSSFAEGDDRYELWIPALEATRKSPIWGMGMWGDRPIVHGYVHNFFVELLCSYGFVFGGIIIVVIIVMVARTLSSGRQITTELFSLFLISLPMGLVQLMFSGSYLTNMWFFFFLGLLINCNRQRKEYSNFAYLQ